MAAVTFAEGAGVDSGTKPANGCVVVRLVKTAKRKRGRIGGGADGSWTAVSSVGKAAVGATAARM